MTTPTIAPLRRNGVDHRAYPGQRRSASGGGRVESPCPEFDKETAPGGVGVDQDGAGAVFAVAYGVPPASVEHRSGLSQLPSPLPLRVLTCQATGNPVLVDRSAVAMGSLQTRFEIEEDSLHGAVAQRRPA